MFGSEMLEVLIGVIFVFFLVSVIVSTVREGIEGWVKARAAFLEHGIRELLNDTHGDALARSLYRHPLILGLYAGDYTPIVRVTRPPGGGAARMVRPSAFTSGKDLPSYIPSRAFAAALLDIAARGPEGYSGPRTPVASPEAIRASIANIPSAPVRRALLAAVDGAQGSMERLRQSVEAWYDAAMDRVSGRYRRSTQWTLFWTGLGVAVALNVNTLTIADYLYRNDAARAALVAEVERRTAAGTARPDTAYASARRALDSLSLPIGWSRGWRPQQVGPRSTDVQLWRDVLGPVLGWLLTAIAATFGAPFWFDLLNKMMVIRSTVKPREKSPEEASEDRQLKPERGGREQPREEAPVGEQRVQGEQVEVASGEPQRETAEALGLRPANLPDRADQESDIDACDAATLLEGEAQHHTSDEELPAATGGVL